MSDPEQEFQAAIAAAGLTPPDSINADGKIHRFSTNGKRGDDSGWYVLHTDGLPAGDASSRRIPSSRSDGGTAGPGRRPELLRIQRLPRLSSP